MGGFDHPGYGVYPTTTENLMPPILALSVKQPWAHAIIHCGKDIENRKALYGRRGPTLIHASAAMTPEYYAWADDFMARLKVSIPAPSRLDRGGIIGIVDIVDAVPESTSRWWMGPCGLVLANARPLPFIPCKGTVAPMFWTPPPEVMERVRHHLA